MPGPLADPVFEQRLKAALRDRYGTDGVLEQLDGEFDLNFSCRAQPTDRDLIVKVMRTGCNVELVAMQCEAMRRVRERYPRACIPDLVRTVDGDDFTTMRDTAGERRIMWVMTRVAGKAYAECRPRPSRLVGEIGRSIAEFNDALVRFDHALLKRDMKWDLQRPGWIREQLAQVGNQSRRALVSGILDRFDELEPALREQSVITLHNDVNDYNLIVEQDASGDADFRGLIDFGDMLKGPAVCELAIAGAYLVLDEERPFDVLAGLIAGYHRVRALSGAELDLIFPLLLTRLAVSVVNAAMMKLERPNDPYVSVTEVPAWTFLERFAQTPPAWIATHLKLACALPGIEGAAEVLAWLESNCSDFGRVLSDAPSAGNYLDLGVGTSNDVIDSQHRKTLNGAIGRYGEARLAPSVPAFTSNDCGAERHGSVHIGLDIYAPATESIRAPIAGVVHALLERHDVFGPAGIAIVLRHRTDRGGVFFTLYGNLSAAAASIEPGSNIACGDVLGRLRDGNGSHAPHLHLQLGLLDLGVRGYWPINVHPDDAQTWKAMFPNPARLLGLACADTDASPTPVADLRSKRKQLFGENLKLSYREPIVAARGWRHFLFDSWGRPYLDAYNNVPHVGHCHPRIAAAAARQAGILSTNTRYLHPSVIEYAEALVAKFPEPLQVCYFVNSASEANELALRLARAATGARDTIVMEECYHGNTNTAIDISAYKFNGPGGSGPADWVHVVPLADPYRGPFRRDDPNAGARYAASVEQACDRLRHQDRKLAAFICESLPSVGGQIVFPPGYLRAVYAAVRAAGGCCIADEVQTGLGRLGDWFWGFQSQDVVPDIVVLGKPLGNGHPIGAVVTTRRIADAFNNGMEFFSTFGGNTVSAVVGLEVLKVIEDENIQERARDIGARFRTRLEELQQAHGIIGDVRGFGLFWGVELVTDRESQQPATAATRYVINRLREERVLAGTEGRFDNVLKIRPPMTFDERAVHHFVSRLDLILREDFIARSSGPRAMAG
jgi:4-aminobutyrate aminotransferase-like enzyme/Ser/Thr protein kinase RdoA (MazF antagonist)